MNQPARKGPNRPLHRRNAKICLNIGSMFTFKIEPVALNLVCQKDRAKFKALVQEEESIKVEAENHHEFQRNFLVMQMLQIKP